MKKLSSSSTRRGFLKWGIGLTVGGLLTACGAQSRTPTASLTPAVSTSGLPTPAIPAQFSLPSCIVRPEQTLGPYFVDEMLNRSDITSDPLDGSVKEGMPLQLVFNVYRLDGSSCTALAGATVDIWHCDAAGIYSDVEDPGFNTRGQRFLRGYQLTDLEGRAEFATIFPGWYQGRTVHIHFKIRTADSSQQAYDFTSQIYFDDSLTDEVHAQPPYASKGQRTVRNDGDGIYRNAGDQLTLEANRSGDGYAGTFNIGLEMT